MNGGRDARTAVRSSDSLPCPRGQIQRVQDRSGAFQGSSEASCGSAAGSRASASVLVCVSGRVGLWKDIFTVSMNEKFDLVYKQKMGKCDLTFDFYL